MRALVVVCVIVVLATYVTWTAGRLDRLHARVDAAWAALDAQLVRRAAAARALVPALPPGEAAQALQAAATASLAGGPVAREQVENDLSRALRAAVPLLPAGLPSAGLRAASQVALTSTRPDSLTAVLQELESAVSRVGLARSLHNVAVADTRGIRLRRMPQALRLAGRRAMPLQFDIDDTALPRRPQRGRAA